VTSFLIALVGAFICVLLFYSITRVSLLYTKYECKRAIREMEISKEIALLVHDVAKEESKLDRHVRIKEYLSGVNYLFDKHFLMHQTVKVVHATTFSDERKTLIKEYKSAPKEVKTLVHRYSTLLENIYRNKHPFKWAFSELKFKFIRLTILYIAIPVLESIRDFLESRIRAANRKKKKKSTPHRSLEYKEQLKTEAGRIRVAA